MKYSVVIFCLFAISLKAQVYFDHSWVFGYPTDTGSTSEYCGTLVTFNSDNPALTWFDIPFALSASAAISDSSGSLLFYTNDCDIANRNHEIMANGDEINKTGLAYEQECLGSLSSVGYNYGYSTHQGALILPWPGRLGIYALFHLHKPDPFSRQFIQNLKYTVIDMAQDGGLGAVIEKNHQVFHDTFCDMLTAVRHANGRDWWLVLPRYNTGAFYVFLFTPEGVGTPEMQKIGVPIDISSFGVQACFSPNGRKYANLSWGSGGLQVFDFDRCSGQLSNPIHIEFPSSTAFVSGVAFSPSSRFLYISLGSELHQADLRGGDFGIKKRIIFIDEYDGYANPLPTNFYQLMLAPNGKIYMTTGNGSKYLHVIHHPDSLGLACTFVQRGLKLLGYYGFSPPNFPHFRLYDLPGSPCDTLGINGPQPPEDTLSSQPSPPVCAGAMQLWPNPATDQVQLELPACVGGSVRVYDLAGRWVQDIAVPEGGGAVPLDVSGYPPGVYMLYWEGQNGVGVPRRLVVLR